MDQGDRFEVTGKSTRLNGVKHVAGHTPGTTRSSIEIRFFEFEKSVQLPDA